MKKCFYFIFYLFLCIKVFCEYDINEDVFYGIDLLNSEYKDLSKEMDVNYNIAYSSFLPSGGIYLITDSFTGKEAVIQIGNEVVDTSPYNLYLPEYLYNFFVKNYKEEVDKIKLKIKFMAWNKKGEGAYNLNIYSLVVKPEDALAEIRKNGEDKYYLQIGAFSYYQNSYPLIIDLLPYLKGVPYFYMININKDKEEDSMFRVLAGPYSLDTAKEVIKKINSIKKKSIFLQSGKTIIEGKK